MVPYGLFKDQRFFLYDDKYGQKFNKAQMKKLLKIAGGKIVEDAEVSDISLYDYTEDKKESKEAKEAILGDCSNKNKKILNHLWVFDSLEKFKLQSYSDYQ